MKLLACIISIYILSLAFAPAAKLVMSVHAEKCGGSCSSKPETQKDADGCAEQTCSPFSCCLKTLVFIETSFFYSQKPSPGYDTDDNYVLKSLFDSGRVKGVWHPPKFARIG
ncbi:MAG: hypothetical protein ACO1N9_02495 [Flavobacterium sp.]|jgi:hypothetical protein|uniref:hypothetical protein n=1 Tax=Flavobacterium sp. J372 TaxID=2898436 RepID=UPI00215124F9|nr:hypothetical protein [Flavobacterium sp. J372]MCR5862576.1 hypothetical protein [Flavobacterium sp. J372]MDC7217465.1 hypothetical protein [Spirochaetales bacterium]